MISLIVTDKDYHLSRLQAFLDFRGFDFRDFRFIKAYNSTLFSSTLVLLVTSIYAVFASAVFVLCPHIVSVNQGMPVHMYYVPFIYVPVISKTLEHIETFNTNYKDSS